jgi:hypothetical protein
VLAGSVAKIFLETVDLMHPLMQNRDDTDITIGKSAPIDEMVLVSKEVSFNAKLCRDLSRDNPMGLDPLKRRKHADDVAIGLILAPSVARVAVNVIEAARRRFLNSDCHLVRPGSGQ